MGLLPFCRRRMEHQQGGIPEGCPLDEQLESPCFLRYAWQQQRESLLLSVPYQFVGYRNQERQSRPQVGNREDFRCRHGSEPFRLYARHQSRLLSQDYRRPYHESAVHTQLRFA